MKTWPRSVLAFDSTLKREAAVYKTVSSSLLFQWSLPHSTTDTLSYKTDFGELEKMCCNLLICP